MSLQSLIPNPDRVQGYQRAHLEVEETELIAVTMKRDEVSYGELARRLGKDREYVQQLLCNGEKLTVNDLADIFTALGYSLQVATLPLTLSSTLPLPVPITAK